MKDRQPTYPGRVLITPENGEAYYATLTRADEPTEAGTPLNKQTLLQDQTEIELFGNADNRTVNDALYYLTMRQNMIIKNKALLHVTVQDGNGNPCTSVPITGLSTADGSIALTGADGVANGYVDAGSRTVQINHVVDLTNVSQSGVYEAGTEYYLTLTPARRNFMQYTASEEVYFSGEVSSADVSVVSGGENGGNGSFNGTRDTSGKGGNTGTSVIEYGASVTPGTSEQVIVGSAGGTSSFLGISASPATSGGGAAVSADIKAGNSVPGNSGQAVSYQYFSSYTDMASCGGNGGSGAAYGIKSPSAAGGTGSAPFGGNGGLVNGRSGNHTQGGNATGYGGAGGGGAGFSGATTTEMRGGTGFQGIVTTRIHFKKGIAA